MKVSIIIPYKKDRGYLKYAIESCHKQTCQDFEIIESKSDGTVGFNFNRGLEKATGELVRYLCDDDILPANSIADTIEYFKANPETDWIHSRAYRFSTGMKMIEHEEPIEKIFTARRLAMKNFIHGGTTVYKTETLKKIGGFNETFWTGEELDLHLRLLSGGYKMDFLNKFLYSYRVHLNQKSRMMGQNKTRVDFIKKFREKYL